MDARFMGAQHNGDAAVEFAEILSEAYYMAREEA